MLLYYSRRWRRYGRSILLPILTIEVFERKVFNNKNVMSSIEPSSSTSAESTIDFICCSERVSFSWLLISQKFHRFSEEKYQNTSHVLGFSIDSVKKLHLALTTNKRPIMEDVDADLLNWLMLKDFRDAYKMYTKKPYVPSYMLPASPNPSVTNPVNDGTPISWAQRRSLVSK